MHVLRYIILITFPRHPSSVNNTLDRGQVDTAVEA